MLACCSLQKLRDDSSAVAVVGKLVSYVTGVEAVLNLLHCVGCLLIK